MTEIKRDHFDFNFAMRIANFIGQRLEAIQPTRDEDEMPAARGELPGKIGAQTCRSARDHCPAPRIYRHNRLSLAGPLLTLS